jgi:uncharacterized protein (DUF2267 family)
MDGGSPWPSDHGAMSYEHDQFLTTVQQKAGISRERAEGASRATLETLAERLSAGEARDIAAQLPPELAPYLPARGDAEGFDLDEFLRRVAEREGVDVPTAADHARAVFAALRRAVDPGEIEDLAAQLPNDFAPLLSEAEGQFFELMPAETFYQRVADRAGLPVEHAPPAVDAVLETLAERIAGGEVADLISHLPVELHPALRRGADRTRHATRMSLDDFVNRVAEREGISADTAREHVRAVFETLREAIDHGEFLDITAQLPAEYATVGAQP